MIRNRADDRELLRQYDHHLAQLTLEGDTEAWVILYQNAYEAVEFTAYRCNFEGVLTKNDLEDMVEESFIRAYERLSDFEARSRFSTWVSGFTKKISLEFKRRYYTALARQRRYSYRPEVSYPDPEYSCLLKERDFCLWLAFDSLSDTHRALLSCYVLKWCSEAETKKKTGMKIGQMRCEKNAAIAALKSRYFASYWGPKRAETDTPRAD